VRCFKKASPFPCSNREQVSGRKTGGVGLRLLDEILNTDIEDANENPNLNTLSKAILAGQQILELSARKEHLKHHDVIVISLYRKY
jgi:hypothetical protein